MSGVSDHLRSTLDGALELLSSLVRDPGTIPFLERTAARFRDVAGNRGRIFICGNGGSLADATHFAQNATGRYRKNREALPVIALADPAHITCVANDYGFHEIFARPILALGHPGDLLLALSTGGNSENVIQAVGAARKRGVHVIGFLGRGGGQLKSLCDDAIVVPGETADRIQELHMLLLHAVMEGAERGLFPDHYAPPGKTA